MAIVARHRAARAAARVFAGRTGGRADASLEAQAFTLIWRGVGAAERGTALDERRRAV